MKRPLVRPPGRPAVPLAPRILAVLAAVLIVASIALASLLPLDMSLAGALHAAGIIGPAELQHTLLAMFGHFVWRAMLAPLLGRPVWLIPICLGLICVGGAVTAMTQHAPRPRQRRS